MICSFLYRSGTLIWVALFVAAQRQNAEEVRHYLTRIRNVPLPFLGKHMMYHVPNGWVYPMLAAFRANADWNINERRFEWKRPLSELVPQVIDDLVGVCVTEHRDNNLQPDKVGKRESTYVQCYDKLLLHLLQTRKD